MKESSGFFLKFIFFIGAVLSVSINLSAQSPRTVPADYNIAAPVNYIRTWDAKAPEQNSNNLITRPVRDVQQTTQYIDGLGRPLQTVVKQGSMITGSTPVDLIDMTEYDAFGREVHKYLPTPSTENNGLFKLNPFTQQANFYGGSNSPVAGQAETFFYSKTNYEASPLNRVMETFAPGNSWVGSEASAKHGIKIGHYTNTASDGVRIWTVVEPTFGQLAGYTSTTAYAAGELFKTITTDEHDKQVIEFKDKQGQVILKKVQTDAAVVDDGGGAAHTNWACTYYIYDDLNRLRAVIQPEGVKTIQSSWNLTTQVRGGFCFQYEYDERSRMIIKKVPAADPEYMVYDKRDRLVMSQDGKQRALAQPIWVAYLYDDLNRLRFTGFTNASHARYYSNRSFVNHIGAAKNTIDYPFGISNMPVQTIWPVMEEIFYDDYESIPPGQNLSKNLNAEHVSYFHSTYHTAPHYADPVAVSYQTKGMVTWKRHLITGSNNYIITVYMYDDKGRVIQEKRKNNPEGNIDIVTTQYSWSGQPLRVMARNDKRVLGTSQFIRSYVITDYAYDDLGRLLTTGKKTRHQHVNSNALPAQWTVISSNEYNALGQLRQKALGRKKDPVTQNYTAEPIEYQNYSYNIRGWLLGVNRSLLGTTAGAPMTPAGTNGNYFGFDLGYDKVTSPNGSLSYNQAQYNGNIGGMQWKSKGDETGRVYNFTYDALNRLTGADFKQNESGASGWSKSLLDFTVSNLSYDFNGNIKSMNQKAHKISSGNIDLDVLSYDYVTNSNQLRKVSDAATDDGDSGYGDFKDGTNTNDDYVYDKNGNLTIDRNKDISIDYLRTSNLVRTVTKTNKGIITYTYDNSGDRLEKQVVETAAQVLHDDQTHESDITTTTKYISGSTYETKLYSKAILNTALGYTDKLQFMAMEEGRIRALYNNPVTPHTLTGFAYDYFVKDHLANVRMVLTEEQKQDIYPAATLEGNIDGTASPDAVAVEKDFYDIKTANIESADNIAGLNDEPSYPNHNNIPNNNSFSNTAANSGKLYRLHGTTQKTGLGIALKVMAGDAIDILGKSYYFSAAVGSPQGIPVTEILSGLLLAPTGVAAGHGLNASMLETAAEPGIMSLFTQQGTETPANVPRAYINYIFFDEQFKPVKSGFSKVGTAGQVHTHDDLKDIVVPKNGYVYIYASNESPVNVFFDNLQVVHNRSAILEETHYYPFGLTMAGISSKALNGIAENKFKFNGGNELQNKEFSDGSGLDWYDATYRGYDPQIGRFMQVDPLADIINNWSPYAFVQNNPILYNDPLGLDTTRGSTPKSNPMPGDVWIIDEEDNEQIFDEDQGWTPNNVLQEIFISKSSAKNDPSAIFLVNAPEYVPKFEGFWGNLDYYWNGGIVGNGRYNKNGELVGMAPIGGTPPTPGRVNPKTVVSAVKTVGNSSKVLLNTSRQLQAKFKHAGDFGVVGNYSKANAAKFSSALNQHINASGTQIIQGVYRNASNPVTFYLNPQTGLNVIASPSGQFISGAALSPAQVQGILTKGFLW